MQFALILSFLASVCQVHFLTTDQADPPEENLWQTLEELVAAQNDNESPYMTCTYSQTRSSLLFEEAVESTGSLAVSEAVALWRDDAENGVATRIENGVIDIYYPEQHQIERYNFGEDNPALLSLASPGPQLDPEQLQALREWMILDELQSGEALCQCTFLPRDPEGDLASYITSLTFYLDIETGLLNRVVTEDSYGDLTDIQFDSIIFHDEVDAEALELNAPEGTEVVEPAE